METVKTTVMYDGQFWIALVEKISPDSIMTARYVFGPEPGNAELLRFYLTDYDNLRFLKGSHDFRLKQRYSPKEEKRMGNKSQAVYKAALEEQMKLLKKQKSETHRIRANEQYQLNRQKKKRRKRGH